MKNLKLNLSRRLWGLSLILVLNTFILGVISYFNNRNLIEQLHDVAQTQLPAVRNMTLIDMMHDGIRAVVYQGLLAVERGATGDANAIQTEYKEFASKSDGYMGELGKLSISANAKGLVGQAKPRLDAYIKAGQEILDLALAGKKEEAYVKLPQFLAEFDKLEAELEELGEVIEKESVDSSMAASRISDTTQTMSLTFLFLGVFGGLLVSVLVIRSLNQRITRVGETLLSSVKALGGASGEIRKVSERVAQSSTQQSATVTEAVASVTTISELIRKTAESAQSSLVITKNSQREIQENQRVLSEMSDSVRAINESNEKLLQLNGMFQDVRDKTKFINTIVFKTGLLSFNAAIEAARAGEHGRGFSVVANEVGNLANLSGRASAEISNLLDNSNREVDQIIRGIQERIARAAEVSQKSEESFLQLGRNLEKIVEVSNAISRATIDQNAGMTQTHQSMKEMETVVRSNNEGSTELVKTAFTVGKAVQEVQGAVDDLSDLIAA